MKRVLIVPKDATGIVDIRKLDYLILENVTYLEEITTNMITANKTNSTHKFCQFESDVTIPLFLKIKDRITSGSLVEFETEFVKFSEIETDDLENLIKERFLNPMLLEKNKIGSEILEMIVSEKLGSKLTDEDYKDLKVQNKKNEKNIKDFDYKKFLDKIV